MFGDGCNDICCKGKADLFVGYGGNEERQAVKECCDLYIYDYRDIIDCLRG